MTIRKKSKEELQNQAEGFLDYASERGKITEKQKKRISKILGINESDKKGFLEWLSMKFGEKIDISDESEIKKVLKKKKIDVEKLGAEYSKYLKIVKFFEPYKTPFDDLNAEIINFISKNYSGDIVKKVKIFMSSKFYKEEYIGGNIRDVGCLEYYFKKIKDLNDLELLLNDLSFDVFFDLYCFKLLDEESLLKTVKSNLLYLKEHGYNTHIIDDYNDLINDDIVKCVDFIEKCDVDLFWDNFNQTDGYYDEDLKNILLKFKDYGKDDLLVNCLKGVANHFDKIINKRPDTYHEMGGGYQCRFVHMARYYNDEYKERSNYFHSHGCIEWKFLAYLWSLYWTTNWKKNINFLHERGLIQSKDIIVDDNRFSPHERACINCNIAMLKKINHDVLKILITGSTTKDSFDKFMSDMVFSDDSIENLKLIIERYKVDLDTLVRSDSLFDVIDNAKKDNIEMIFGKYDASKLSIKKIVEAPGLFIDAIPENLKIIFDEYKNIECIELMDLGDTVCNLSTECLQLIIGHYKNVGKKVSYTELEDLAGCFSHAKLENLKIILDKFDNIDDIKKLTSKNLASKELHIYGEPRNLKIILDRFDDVDDIQELAQIIRDAKPENLKIIFEKFDKQGTKLTPKDLDELNNVICLAIPENLELIFEKFLDINNNITVNDLKEFDVLLRFCYGLPKDLIFKESNKKGYLDGLIEIVNSNYENELKCNMMRTLVSLNFQEAGNLLKVYKMLDNSISPDIQLIKNQLIVEILKAGDPLTLSKIIINIFEKNNLPMTGKIFKIFELLYPKSRIESLFQKYPYSSPELKSLLDEGKNVYELIYRDLMNIAVKSGDHSLREYLKTFIGSEQLLREFESIINEEGFNPDDNLCLEGKLDEEKQAQLLYLFRRMAVLYNRYYGKEIYEDDSIESLKVGKSKVTDSQLVKMYDEIKKGFNIKGKNHSLYDKLKMLLYVNGLKYHSPEEVLDEMDKSKRRAHEKGLKLYNESEGGKIKFPEEAFVKGVSDLSFKKIIGRGITSREYLGSGYDLRSTGVCGSAWGNSATSDTTPFDIDGFCSDHFVKAGSSGGISGSDKESSIGYGYVNFVIDITKKDENGNLIIYDNTPNKNDKHKLRWDTIRRNNFNIDEKYNIGQYELFQTETSEGIEHCGIRTGIAMTEVDYIIYTGNFEGKDFQDMCYEIARNGYYIPVTDGEGNIKFTPEMYHKIRAGFNYMEYYDGYDVEIKDGKYVSRENYNTVNKTYNGDNEKIKDSDVIELISENSPKNEKYQKFAKENRELAESTIEWIKKILYDECGIIFNSEFDSSITGAELHDSGSTGRGTDIPTKDVDLDFTLLLDANDYNNKLELIRETIYRVTGTTDTGGQGPRTDVGGRELGYQIKSQRNTLGLSDERPNGIPLDLLILKKSQVIDYSSSDAMKEKLDFIASNPKTGEEDLNRVRTNVIIMKKLLKAKRCYKKPEGGISGIGVENRIIQNHGNFIEALESFEKVVYGGEYEEGKAPKPLSEFKKLYSIYDAGENYKDGCNDNFVYKLNEHGYNGMLQIVQALRTKGIDGIREMIKEYETKKSEFIE